MPDPGPDRGDESPQRQFDSIRQINPYGEEYWSARELMPLLGYDSWRRFAETIDRALSLCTFARQDPSVHFLIDSKDAVIGYGAVRKITDYHLTRYALFLIPYSSRCGRLSGCRAGGEGRPHPHERQAPDYPIHVAPSVV